MVRESVLKSENRKQKIQRKRKICFSIFSFFLFSVFFSFTVCAAEGDKTSQTSHGTKSISGPSFPSIASTEDEGEKKELVLKIMIVNPSKQHKQVYPMKAYLPEEIQPKHILSKEDLEIGFDADKNTYYVTKQLELDPGQSVVKTIKVEDIWRIPDKQLKDISEEASQLFKKVEGTSYEEKARLLLSNMEVLLTQIYELQNDATMTPEEHISAYRENKSKLREIELDMIALRRLVFQAATGKSTLGGNAGTGAGAGFLGAAFNPETVSKENKGSLPEWVAWRVIFMILGFLALGANSFYLIWNRQLSALEARKKLEASKQKPQTIFEDVLGNVTVENTTDKIIIPTSAKPQPSTKPKGQVA